MCEYQTYYAAFKTGYWAQEKAEDCPCNGSGWTLSEVDTWHECPVHHKWQCHPESGCEDADCPACNNVGPLPALPPPPPPPTTYAEDDIPF